MTAPDQARHTPANMNSPTIDERANHCFGCGPANPQGLHLTFTTDSSPNAIIATAHFQLDQMHEGPPGHIHGGIVATLLDEAMSKVNRPLNVLAMTRHIEVDYLRPVPLYQPLVLIGRHLNRPADAQGKPGRKIFNEAEIQHPDGTVLARGKGFFIAVSPEMLAAAGLAES
jgi:acyl-coenzyme A thioesterase PaaI-like protein